MKGVALVVFAFLATHLVSASPIQNGTCDLGIRPLVETCLPDRPSWAPHFLHPGILQFPNGVGVELTKHALQNPEKVLSLTEQVFKAFPPERIESVKRQAPRVPYREGEGVVKTSGLDLDFYVGFQRGILEGYRKALHFLYQKIAVEKKIFEGDPKTLIRVLKRAHRLLFEGTVQEVPIGAFRTSNAFVPPRFARTEEDFVRLLREKGASFEEIGLFRASYARFSFLRDTIRSLSSEERRVWEKIFSLPPFPEEIIPALSQLALRLPQLNPDLHEGDLNEQLRCITEIYLEIERIHPFGDGNGRMGRAFVQAMLANTCGWLIFPSNAEYVQATYEGLHNPSAFEAYLRKVIRWNHRHRATLQHWANFLRI